jgi:uncharacterized SAM-binding protein YcdF (DUF218 family)
LIGIRDEVTQFPHRRRVLWLAGGCALIIVVWLSRSVWLDWPARWLDVGESPEPADVIVVPSGHAYTRIHEAGLLVSHGYARTVFLTTSDEPDQSFLLMGMRVTERDLLARLMARERIPSEIVTLGPAATSTRADSLAFRYYASAKGVHSAILVTSHLHSRRARWAYRRALAGLPVRLITIETPQSDFPVHRWWQTEDGLLNVVTEYLKFGFYLVHY